MMRRKDGRGGGRGGSGAEKDALYFVPLFGLPPLPVSVRMAANDNGRFTLTSGLKRIKDSRSGLPAGGLQTATSLTIGRARPSLLTIASIERWITITNFMLSRLC